MSDGKDLPASFSVQRNTPRFPLGIEEGLIQKLVRWKNIIYQNCPGKFVGGGLPYCLLGGTPCSYLHCPRNIYVQSSLESGGELDIPIPEKIGHKNGLPA